MWCGLGFRFGFDGGGSFDAEGCARLLLDVAVGVVVEGALAFGGAEVVRGVVVVGEEACVVGFDLLAAD